MTNGTCPNTTEFTLKVSGANLILATLQAAVLRSLNVIIAWHILTVWVPGVKQVCQNTYLFKRINKLTGVPEKLFALTML